MIDTWKTKPIDIEMKPDAKPYYAKPYPIQERSGKAFLTRVDLKSK